MPCNLGPVVAKLEFTGIWVALIFPIFVLCVAVSGKFTEVVKVLGFSLNRGAAFRGGSGQYLNCTHLTSSIETVHGKLGLGEVFVVTVAKGDAEEPKTKTTIGLHKSAHNGNAIKVLHHTNSIEVDQWST